MTNDSFIDGNAADGLRKCLTSKFSHIYVLICVVISVLLAMSHDGKEGKYLVLVQGLQLLSRSK